MASENGSVIAFTEPQIWVLIGVFCASIFSIVGIQTASFNRNLTTSISALRESMEAKFDGLRSEFSGRFEAVDAKFDGLRAEMNARFDATNTKIDGIDSGVQVLTKRVFDAD